MQPETGEIYYFLIRNPHSAIRNFFKLPLDSNILGGRSQSRGERLVRIWSGMKTAGQDMFSIFGHSLEKEIDIRSGRSSRLEARRHLHGRTEEPGVLKVSSSPLPKLSH
ncbi:hypothetical protein [Candidatus Manganitrophus noduliformans]|uniref:hypothetical protein n=1 Tax=Candidatus Manganitrophus noduliformans TaxID=2606439 RepID=UPI00143B7B8D|nr:hypothetical protein [Candidatus Manganitrophus noduliformans]